MKMNLPNKLTLLRVIMIPTFMVFIIFNIGGNTVARIVAAALFLLASITDMVDGQIARKYNLITDMGKFLDPLADKLLIFGAFISILVMTREDRTLMIVCAWAAFAVILREMAVTSMRLLVVTKSDVVIAANILGKIKTVSQMTCVMTLLLEPVIFSSLWTAPYLSYITLVVMTVMTIWSGINYFMQYAKYLK